MSNFRHGDGAYYEHGPRTLRPSGVAGANTLQLIEEIGLEVSKSLIDHCRISIIRYNTVAVDEYSTFRSV